MYVLSMFPTFARALLCRVSKLTCRCTVELPVREKMFKIHLSWVNISVRTKWLVHAETVQFLHSALPLCTISSQYKGGGGGGGGVDWAPYGFGLWTGTFINATQKLVHFYANFA